MVQRPDDWWTTGSSCWANTLQMQSRAGSIYWWNIGISWLVMVPNDFILLMSPGMWTRGDLGYSRSSIATAARGRISQHRFVVEVWWEDFASTSPECLPMYELLDTIWHKEFLNQEHWSYLASAVTKSFSYSLAIQKHIMCICCRPSEVQISTVRINCNRPV